jgi:hypothetical protein
VEQTALPGDERGAAAARLGHLWRKIGDGR